VFVAMNNFRITPGREADFERQWRERESYLKDVPGFIEFMLLRGDEQGEYISQTLWTDRAAFVAWTQSPQFTQAHRQGSLQGVVAGPPHAKLYEVALYEGEQHASSLPARG